MNTTDNAPRYNPHRREFAMNLWRWACGLPEEDTTPAPKIDMEALRRSEWNAEFETLMRNRLVMGALRYGKIGAPGKPQYDRVASMLRRLQHYADTGNKEFLVDVANLCLLEFTECHHPNAHFAAIDDGEHVVAK